MNMAGIVKGLHAARGQIDTALSALNELFTIGAAPATGIAAAPTGARTAGKARHIPNPILSRQAKARWARRKSPTVGGKKKAVKSTPTPELAKAA